jgi:hypothetical protein
MAYIKYWLYNAGFPPDGGHLWQKHVRQKDFAYFNIKLGALSSFTFSCVKFSINHNLQQVVILLHTPTVTLQHLIQKGVKVYSSKTSTISAIMTP